MFRGLPVLIALLAPAFTSADPAGLNWNRLDRIVLPSGWAVVEKAPSYRQFSCEDCEEAVTVTIWANALSSELRQSYSASQSVKAYRIQRCRTLVQSGEGRCVNENHIEYSNGQVRHETVLIYGGTITWGFAEGPKGYRRLNEVRGPWMQHLVKSLTPLY